jgi:hypothetical protein
MDSHLVLGKPLLVVAKPNLSTYLTMSPVTPFPRQALLVRNSILSTYLTMSPVTPFPRQAPSCRSQPSADGQPPSRVRGPPSTPRGVGLCCSKPTEGGIGGMGPGNSETLSIRRCCGYCSLHRQVHGQEVIPVACKGSFKGKRWSQWHA